MPIPPYQGTPASRRVIDVGRPRRRRARLALLAVAAAALLGLTLFVTWYVEALWFASLGFSTVFWRTLFFKAAVFALFGVATLFLMAAALWAIRPRGSAGRTVIVNGQPITVSFGPVVTVALWATTIVAALVSASTMMEGWAKFALFWYRSAPGSPAASVVDPIFGRPVEFYLFTLPVWQVLTTWAATLSLVVFAAAAVVLMVTEGEQVLTLRRVPRGAPRPFGPISFAVAGVLLAWALRVYVARFDLLFADHPIFSGVTYTDAHILVPGLGLVAAALALGGVIACANGLRWRRLTGIVLAILPAVAVYAGVRVTAWYVAGFIVKPNELVRETPFIRHNINFTSRAFGLAGVEQRPFPAEPGVEAIDVPNNRVTLRNIRLWDWRALQDTLHQIQEIRTYYDFADIDIDRYRIGGETRQVMVAAREFSVDKLPESSRTWVNEKLIYTHGYGVTMNTVNGFTAEGLPELLLSDMPVRSASPDLKVTRPEIYFGQLTNTDVYVRTHQKEFNYPLGESNSYTSYDGTGGIPVGGVMRRTLLALNRGDISKLPFSDDVHPDSRLLMRRNILERVTAIAPFLVFDPDPYLVVRADGRLSWVLDAYTVSDCYPYARAYRVSGGRVNYIRNSVKVVIDAYDGTVTFYVFDAADPIVAAYRRLFPALFQDAGTMPADLREHVRYPELLLMAQGTVYCLYHMRDPAVFYNREDLWTIASQVTLSETREQVARPLEPNFLLMQLPGEPHVEFIAILPFTPSNRNNLIGWIAGRSDGGAYGTAIVFDFPKTRLVDGPLQVEARIDQDPQLSAQMTLWNQQGSHTRRGGLLVLPIGRGLLYAEPIYLQAERSPMPQLRLVVLALQGRLGFGPTFEDAMASLFGAAGAIGAPGAGPASLKGGAAPGGVVGLPPAFATPAGSAPLGVTTDVAVLVDRAARELAEYQQLTAEGKLGEAGQRLESLKRTLDELMKLRQQR